MLRTSDLDYDLPESAIATTPAEPRDAARMLVTRIGSDAPALHAHVRDLPSYLNPGDLLVVNQTRVLPARVEGVREDTGGRVEGLYLRGEPGPPRTWTLMLQAKRPREDAVITLAGAVRFRLLAPLPDEPGAWRAELMDGLARPDETDAEILARIGATPLPPYIRGARKRAGIDVADAADRERYQTVFAERDGASVAAPTAGLHLTPDLLARLRAHGVGFAAVTLHVGTGTFRSVETEFIEQHPMHAEWCAMPVATRDLIAATRSRGGRVVCVGTTSARTVEAFALAAEEGPAPEWLETRLLITPGYRWRSTDALLTNFHLPRSTLLALVASRLASPGDDAASAVTRLKTLYADALARGYRFYSYGDATLILP
ncbi:MAG TPA: tRNA preQ1(34) S-adenosylmethionine ribosyltransferase-isomerase QueA [Tepidisphaeraceae bacterium]|nr:tRNA preQ1(34) S-adenosylmethionine ribosyltransferase-isomerase QueA [Tepidisphaeraceae bacterium]